MNTYYKNWTKDQLIAEVTKFQKLLGERILKQVELLEKITRLQTQVENLRIGYNRVKAERDEARKELSERSIDLLREKLTNPSIDEARQENNTISLTHLLSESEKQVDALQGEVTKLTAINDNLNEQLKHYKAIAGLNEPGF